MADHIPRLCGFCNGPLAATRYCTKCESMPAQIAYHVLTRMEVEALFPFPCDWCRKHAPWFDLHECRCHSNLSMQSRILS